LGHFDLYFILALALTAFDTFSSPSSCYVGVYYLDWWEPRF